LAGRSRHLIPHYRHRFPAEIISRGCFLSAMVVVRWLIGFVSRNGFGAFAWYRIALHLLMPGVLLVR
jgi:undecaprenyl pyrophosphate phosphatase UppP